MLGIKISPWGGAVVITEFLKIISSNNSIILCSRLPFFPKFSTLAVMIFPFLVFKTIINPIHVGLRFLSFLLQTCALILFISGLSIRAGSWPKMAG